MLFILGASQTQGYRRTSLHPLGSLDDHAYVINDAEITTLIVDPVFVERALGLLDKCPGLKQVLTIGPVPEALAHVGTDLVADGRARTTPQPLEAVAAAARPHDLDHLHRRHDRQAPRASSAGRSRCRTMTQIQLAEWEWPESPRFLMCTPLSHAGAAFFAPTVIKGGSLYVLSKFDPAEVLRVHRGAEDHRDDAGAVDALRADGPPGLAHPRPEQSSRPSTTAPARSTRCGSRRRSTGSARSSRSTTASPRRRW